MCFWYYAFLYLLIGVLLDVGLSKNSKASLWSIFLWPIIALTCIFVLLIALFAPRD